MVDKMFGTGEQLLELASVQRAIENAANWMGAEHARRCSDTTRAYIAYGLSGGEMESPLEAIFYAWFNAACAFDDVETYLLNLVSQAEVALSNGVRYRLDFAVQFGPQTTALKAHERGIPQPKVAIELDGHDFHERTKEQVAYRNERDRELAADGWTVLHFSGSELYRNPLECANRTINFCKQKTDEWSRIVYELGQAHV